MVLNDLLCKLFMITFNLYGVYVGISNFSNNFYMYAISKFLLFCESYYFGCKYLAAMAHHVVIIILRDFHRW